MRIRVVGLNHQMAPVGVREALAFRRAQLPEALAALRRLDAVDEATVLSTCNRVEVYLAGPSEFPDDLVPAFLARFHGVWPETFKQYLYTRDDADAVTHLFRVASGLDSLVVGEAQIVGQVKESYELAAEGGATGRVLNRLFQHALSAAKRVRSTTEVAAGRASVGSVAVELAERIFETLAGRTVLVVGAGEMGEAVLRSLRAAGAETTLVANRTLARAEALAAELGGKAVPFDQLADALARADIVISSTDAPHWVIHRPDLAEALRARRGRPVFVIDIAVPRDVEPTAAEVEGCYLYNVDDLQAVVADTLARRGQELERCQAIVDEEAAAYMGWLGRLAVAPTIGELTESLHEIKQRELDALFARMGPLPDDAKAEIERFASRLVQKILHQPIRTLREVATRSQSHSGNLVAAALRLFGLGRRTPKPPDPQRRGD